MRIYTGRIDAKNAPTWFVFAEKFISSALEKAHGELTVGDVRRALVDGKMQLFVILTGEEKAAHLVGAAVTEVVDYYQSCAVRVVTLGGEDLNSWFMSLDYALDKFCREVGAKRIEAACRPGLTRVLEPHGYSQYYVILGKEVKDGKASRYNSDGILNGTARVPDAVH